MGTANSSAATEERAAALAHQARSQNCAPPLCTACNGRRNLSISENSVLKWPCFVPQILLQGTRVGPGKPGGSGDGALQCRVLPLWAPDSLRDDALAPPCSRAGGGRGGGGVEVVGRGPVGGYGPPEREDRCCGVSHGRPVCHHHRQDTRLQGDSPPPSARTHARTQAHTHARTQRAIVLPCMLSAYRAHCIGNQCPPLMDPCSLIAIGT